MSGGFFRGTSADQDTRFSNKQAKLLKSQKFAPELEQLVDMTKVKMDVMRPWIATRVTELIGFEDEVLINFIYGLLDGKEVNGKEVQISLTGFMERNTGKFMKELWSLLLSAQKNASGVPQQFLDAKEEETKKKKAESDRIANEIRKKKEKESLELEQERTQKMDRGNDIMKAVDTGTQLSSKHQPRAKSAEAKASEERNGLRGRSRGRRSRSISKSFSNSRSYSHERRSSRSLSASPEPRGRSSSSELVHHHSTRLSFSPRRRSSYSRRRSLSRSHRRSPSPARYRMRSPLHRRARSPFRRRSRSPIWHRSRSPTRRSSPLDRSQSPIRHRPSFVRHRSPSPVRRISPSPVRRKYQRSPSTPWRRSRSPIQRRYRTPVRHRSPSPVRRRSPSPVRRRSPSPVRHRFPSPVRRRSPSLVRRRSSPFRRRSSPVQRRSPSPIRHESPSPIRRRSPIAGQRRSLTLADHKSPSPRSPSPLCRKSPRRQRRSPLQSPKGRIRSREKYSPARHDAPRTTVEHPTDARQRSNSLECQSQSDSLEQNDLHGEVKRSSPSPQRSPSVSESERKTSLIEKGRKKIPRSDSSNPPRKAREIKHHDDSSEISADDKENIDAREAAKNKHHSTKVSSSDQHKGSRGQGQSKVEFSPVKTDRIELSKTEVLWRGNNSEKLDHQQKPVQQDSQMIMDASYRGKGRQSPVGERHGEAVEKTQSYPADIKINDRHLEAVSKLSREVALNCRSASLGSESEESDKSRTKAKDKRKRKSSERRGLESSDESSYDSYAEKRKEAKRRRKEEKRLKKDERRRRRKEKRRRKEERHVKKQKLKSIDAVSSPSDTEENHDGRFDDDQHVQKKLEIELREKALESLRAKKGIGN